MNPAASDPVPPVEPAAPFPVEQTAPFPVGPAAGLAPVPPDRPPPALPLAPPGRALPPVPVTCALAALVTAAYAGLGWRHLGGAFLVDYWLQPLPAPLYRALGALIPGALTDGAWTERPWWRLLAACFLHANHLHLLTNLLALWLLGRVAERLFGGGWYLLLYVLCGAASSLSVFMMAERFDGMGASGAILGLAGALTALVLRARRRLPPAMVRRFLVSMGLSLVLVFAGGMWLERVLAQAAEGLRIGHWPHALGLGAGLLLGLVLPARLPGAPADAAVRPAAPYGTPVRRSATAWAAGATALLPLAAAFFAAGVSYARAAVDRQLALAAEGEAVWTRDPARALAVYAELTALDPRAREWRVNAALAALNARDLTAARRHFEALRALAPEDPLACYHLGSLALLEQRPDDARALLHRALALVQSGAGRDFYQPAKLRELEALAAFHAGDRVADARRALAALADEQPDQAGRWLLMLAELEEQQGRPREARQALTRLLELPDEPAPAPRADEKARARALLQRLGAGG